MSNRRASLRRRLLSWVGMLIVLSLLSSTLSLFRITEVNKSLETINQVAVPLGRGLVQLKADADTFKREVERRFGPHHWSDDGYRPISPPQWITEMIGSDYDRLSTLTSREGREKWKAWVTDSNDKFIKIQNLCSEVQRVLEEGKSSEALSKVSSLTSSLTDWTYQMEWAVVENERTLRQTFSVADERVAGLKRALAFILGVVACLSLILFWLGERALRPLGQITELAREITRRGLRKEDKGSISLISSPGNDEVSQLATEFYRMTTALLEREKEIESQKQRLTEQNKMLIQMGELQERLKNAEKLAAIGKLSAQVAHEIRNPLHSIGLEAEMALDRAKSDPALGEGLKSILVCVERLQKITENYLKLSKLSRGEKSKIDLSEVLESTLAAYAAQTQALHIKVDWVLDSNQGGYWVWGDQALLEQVFGNLMKNAIQALDDSTSKLIQWRIQKTELGRVVVSIRDSGPGLKNEIIANLFAPFVTTKASGTGLGLSLVKQVLDDHGAKIEMVTQAQNKGSGAMFEMTFMSLPPQMSLSEKGALHEHQDLSH